jgi:PPOX class probable F420-dependent enzyme
MSKLYTAVVEENPMTGYEPFHQQQYLNLETFRKRDVGVKIPLWFGQECNTLLVRTVANSGKVLRIRNNQQVNIAPCKGDVTLLDEWVTATAREVKDQETDRKVNRLLGKKYGLMKTLIAVASTLQGRNYTVLEIYKI